MDKHRVLAALVILVEVPRPVPRRPPPAGLPPSPRPA